MDLHVIRDPSPFHLPTAHPSAGFHLRTPSRPKTVIGTPPSNNEIVVSGQKEKRQKGKPCPFQLHMLPWGDVPEGPGNHPTRSSLSGVSGFYPAMTTGSVAF